MIFEIVHAVAGLHRGIRALRAPNQPVPCCSARPWLPCCASSARGTRRGAWSV